MTYPALRLVIGGCLIAVIASSIGFAVGYYFPRTQDPRMTVFQPSGAPYSSGGDCSGSNCLYGSIQWSGSLINGGGNGYAVVDFKLNSSLIEKNTYYVEASKQVSISHISQTLPTIGWFHSLSSDVYAIIIESQRPA
jgi:hypothetical protein